MSKNSSGFTLIEILVAMVLLVGASVAVMSSFVSSAKMANNNYGVAYNFARGVAEQMKEEVRQDTWLANSGRLSRTSPVQFPATTINGVPCRASHVVNPGQPPNGIDANNDGFEDYRVVDMTVVCQEASQTQEDR